MEENKTAARDENTVAGRNAITEALETGCTIDGIYVVRGNRTGSIGGIIAKAKQSGIPVKDAGPKKLDYLCGYANHQGAVAVATIKKHASLEDLFRVAEERDEPPFFLIADGLEDLHDPGVVPRMAECFRVHGMIVSRCRAAGLTFVVGRASAGVVEHMPVARVTNLPSTSEELKKCGVWTYVADMDGQDWCDVDYRGPAAIVIGSEGFRVSRPIREKSDFIISLPMLGKINLLNASVAYGVIRYEVARQRRGIRAK